MDINSIMFMVPEGNICTGCFYLCYYPEGFYCPVFNRKLELLIYGSVRQGMKVIKCRKCVSNHKERP